MLPRLDPSLSQRGLSVSTWSLSTGVTFRVGGHQRCWPCFQPRDTIAFGEAVQAAYTAGLSFFRNCQAGNLNAAIWKKTQTNRELLKGVRRNTGNLLHLISHFWMAEEKQCWWSAKDKAKLKHACNAFPKQMWLVRPARWDVHIFCEKKREDEYSNGLQRFLYMLSQISPDYSQPHIFEVCRGYVFLRRKRNRRSNVNLGDWEGNNCVHQIYLIWAPERLQ